MAEKRYKLHLTSKQLNILQRVFDNHDWLCDCKDFPNCEDFKIFQKLKKRINNLEEKHITGKSTGHMAFRKLKQKHIQEGANIQYNITKEKEAKHA